MNSRRNYEATHSVSFNRRRRQQLVRDVGLQRYTYSESSVSDCLHSPALL